MSTPAAKDGQNEVITWWRARRFLDTRFIEARQDGLSRLSIYPCAQAVFLRTINTEWRRAAFRLRRELLPQKARLHYRRAIKTVNPNGKARPRDSWLAKRQQRSSSGKQGNKNVRSHHKGKYYPRHQGPGRPAVGQERRKRKIEDYENKRNARNRIKTAQRRKNAALPPIIHRSRAEQDKHRATLLAHSALMSTARGIVGRKPAGSKRTLKGYWRAVHHICPRLH